jgi:hypothetical protein
MHAFEFEIWIELHSLLRKVSAIFGKKMFKLSSYFIHFLHS